MSGWIAALFCGMSSKTLLNDFLCGIIEALLLVIYSYHLTIVAAGILANQPTHSTQPFGNGVSLSSMRTEMKNVKRITFQDFECDVCATFNG